MKVAKARAIIQVLSFSLNICPGWSTISVGRDRKRLVQVHARSPPVSQRHFFQVADNGGRNSFFFSCPDFRIFSIRQPRRSQGRVFSDFKSLFSERLLEFCSAFRSGRRIVFASRRRTSKRKGAFSRILSRCFGSAYWNFVRRSVRVDESALRREGGTSKVKGAR